MDQEKDTDTEFVLCLVFSTLSICIHFMKCLTISRRILNIMKRTGILDIKRKEFMLTHFRFLKESVYILPSGHREAIERWYTSGAKKCKYHFVNGEKDGLCEEWYKYNALLKRRANYLDGQKHGLYQKWFQNGRRAKEYNYVDGLKHGLCRQWLYDGTLFLSHNYVDGTIVYPNPSTLVV